MFSSDPQRPARRFLAAFAAVVLVTAAALLALCWLVDPTGLLREAGLSPGICSRGIHTAEDRYVKPLLIPVLRPAEAIVGTSRSEIAFTAETFRGRHAVNLAVAGATLQEIEQLGRQAIDSGHIRRLWMGLDFGTFIVRESQFREPLRFPSGNRRWVAIRHGLLDSRTMRIALRSLLDRSCADPVYTPSGFRARALPDRAAEPMNWRANRVRWEWENSGPGSPRLVQERLQQLAELLAHARRRGVAVVAYTGPTSTHYRAALARWGLTEEFDRWQGQARRVVERQGGLFVAGHDESLLATLRARHCGLSPGPDCLFIDATHFRPEVGEAIVREALDRSERLPGRAPS